jgi:hypothetical protein
MVAAWNYRGNGVWTLTCRICLPRNLVEVQPHSDRNYKILVNVTVKTIKTCCMSNPVLRSAKLQEEVSLKCDCTVQKLDFVFRRNGRVHLNLPGGGGGVSVQSLATHSIRQFPPLRFPSRASPCAITFQLESASWSVAKPKPSSSCSWL